jgi:hypothetical protein
VSRNIKIVMQAATIVAACFFAGAQASAQSAPKSAPSPASGKPVIVWKVSDGVSPLTLPSPLVGRGERVAAGRVRDAVAFVEIQHLPAATLRALSATNWTPEQWQRAFTVQVETGNIVDDVELPAMAGRYQIVEQALRFEPQFPFEPGVSYRAIVRLNRLPGFNTGEPPLSSVHRVPKPELPSTTVVSAVFPSADVLPENLLKFYVHFSAPMSGGRIYEHIRLLNEKGAPVELPFLEIDEELWNPDMTRLTLFIDPGRIKRGVQPLEEIGPALEEGKSFELVIDRAWRDAQGRALKADFNKRFRVGPPLREALDAAKWKITAPAAGSNAPLTVDFPWSMDAALAQRAIRVADPAGKVMAGDVSLAQNERRWTFAPAAAWRGGAHTLLIQSTLEDLSGNNIGKPFEVDLFERVERRVTNVTVKVGFEVR